MCFFKNARIGNAVKNGKIYWDRYIYWSRNDRYIYNIQCWKMLSICRLVFALLSDALIKSWRSTVHYCHLGGGVGGMF